MAVARPHRFERIRYGTLLALLCAVFAMGGASRNDVISLIVLYPLFAVALAIFVLTPGTVRWHDVRTPLALLLAGAGIAAAQLLPLPPAMWSALPGHGRFVESATVVGMAQPWRPISLVPDLTLSSLLAFLIPVTMLVGCAAVPAARTRDLLTWVAGLAMASALLGLIQITAGPESILYHYATMNTDAPVGFFANRNHQALMLAISFPLLALWAAQMKSHPRGAFAGWGSLGTAVALVPVILATGSRAGLVFGFVGIAAGGWVTMGFGALRRQTPWRRWIIWGAGVALGGIAAITFMVSRAASIQRAMSFSMSEEVRLQYLPLLKQLMRTYFPVGSGLGSFDPIFRSVETLDILQPSYLNHAHNDVIEVIIETGFAGAAVLLGMTIWLVRCAWTLIASRSRSEALWFARVGVLLIGMVVAGSFIDYPLRTPIFAAVFAVAAAWISGYERRHVQTVPD